MSQGEGASEVAATVQRTLLAAGLIVVEGRRAPSHLEIVAERRDALGAKVTYLIAIFDRDTMSEREIRAIERDALKQNRHPVIVTDESADGAVALRDLLDLFGGPVRTWRALDSNYRELLIAASRDVQVEPSPQAWVLFEELVADGLEFILGRRVQRFGQRVSGRAVSDIHAQFPDGQLMLVDAKAREGGFDASTAELRPLGEYVSKQIERQRGTNEVCSALVLSSCFRQDRERLMENAVRFAADYGRPVCFGAADDLADMVDSLREHPDIRLGLRWRRVFSAGPIDMNGFERELREACQERVGGVG